jgi:pilus assembly protein CpaE
VQIAVLVTELTLAAARDTIRILSWLKSNAPQTQVFVLANRVHAGQLEITRKDFEGSIERKIDYVVSFDQKLAAQAAKLGKPMAEAGKGSKTVVPLSDLATQVMASGDAAIEDAPVRKGSAKPGGSLIGKFDLKAMLSKKPKK